jgi:hypothetical protein
MTPTPSLNHDFRRLALEPVHIIVDANRQAGTIRDGVRSGAKLVPVGNQDVARRAVVFG